MESSEDLYNVLTIPSAKYQTQIIAANDGYIFFFILSVLILRGSLNNVEYFCKKSRS